MSTELNTIEDGEAQLGFGGAISQLGQAGTSTQIKMMGMMLDRKISTAKMFPRSIARFKKECGDLLRVDKETAATAEYAKPVGGGKVKGASVRLAELAASCWGNLEQRISEPVITDKSVIVTASVWDLERNVTREAMVSTSIVGKNGQKYPNHMIETAALATAAKAVRNAILGIIPRAFINDLLAIAREVVAGTEQSLAEKRAKTLNFFATSYKVTEQQIYAYLEIIGEDDMTEAHIDDLRLIANAIKTGEATVAEFFPTEEKNERLEAMKAKMKKPDAAAEPEKKETKPTETAKNPEATTDPVEPAESAAKPPETAQGDANKAATAADTPTDDKGLFGKLWADFIRLGGLPEDFLQGEFADEAELLAKCKKPALERHIRRLNEKIAKLQPK
jgi:hypothetical protein